jgi:anti-anti-sigma regulatory factor
METADNADIVLPETSVLRLEGSWTVERANELKELLIGALKSSDHIIVELEELAELDLSCLQLLCSAHYKFLTLGRSLALHEKKSENFKKVVREAGFRRKLGCHENPHAACLWIGEWES